MVSEIENTIIDLSMPKEELIRLASASCKRCGDCCNCDAVLKDEVEAIKDFLRKNRDKFPQNIEDYLVERIFPDTDIGYYTIKSNESGKCVFLDYEFNQGTCKLQEVKPLRCSTYSCKNQGTGAYYYYNYFFNKENPKHLELLGIMVAKRLWKHPVTIDGKPFILPKSRMY